MTFQKKLTRELKCCFTVIFAGFLYFYHSLKEFVSFRLPGENQQIMKFTCSVTINENIDKVVAMFENPDNLKEWQDGFVSHELLNGEPGVPGSQSRFMYMNRNKPMELIETI